MITYDSCYQASRKAFWNFEEELGGLQLNFSKFLLPSSISGENTLVVMPDEDKKLLNHIRAASYCHLFLFIEEYIVLQMISHAQASMTSDGEAVNSLLAFSEEEVKHQNMFKKVLSLFKEEYGDSLNFLPGRAEAAQEILKFPPLSVMLLTTLLEWITQRHYLEFFRLKEEELDPSFSKIFKLHWIEEAQHVKIDTLFLENMKQELSSDEIELALEKFQELLFKLKYLLDQQSTLDFQSFMSISGRDFSSEDKNILNQGLVDAYDWAFITCGLEHQAFQRSFESLSKGTSWKFDKLCENLIQSSVIKNPNILNKDQCSPKLASSS